MGNQVVFYDERPSNTVLVKGLIRINKKLAGRFIDKYYKSIVQQIRNKHFDKIIIFQGEATPEWFLRYLHNNYENTIKILYLWDSVSDKPHSLDYRKYYDKIFTFDPCDANEFQLGFRPLFYINNYSPIDEAKIEKKYRFSFVGTVRNDRYAILQKMKNDAEEKGYSYFVYYFLQSRFIYFFLKFVKREFPQSSIKEFSFKSLSHTEIKRIVNSSEVVIDIQKPDQVGLTIRTIELLCMQKKFATTNKEIVKYDFFNKNNIAILDRNEPFIDSSFIEEKFETVHSEILDSYSLEFFLAELMGEVKGKSYYKI